MTVSQILSYMQGFINAMGLMPFVYAVLVITSTVLAVKALIRVLSKD